MSVSTGFNNQMRPGIPANRQPVLNSRTQPMARPMPGRPMTDSQGHVIGGGMMPQQNQFMPGPFGAGQIGGPQIGFGMRPGIQPPNALPNNIRTNPAQPQPANILPNTATLDPNKPNPANTLPGNVGIGFGPVPVQADGAPTDVPQNPGMGMGGGKGGMGGGKGGFNNQYAGVPSSSVFGPLTQIPINGNLGEVGNMFASPGAYGQGTPNQGGAQFQQNT